MAWVFRDLSDSTPDEQRISSISSSPTRRNCSKPEICKKPVLRAWLDERIKDMAIVVKRRPRPPCRIRPLRQRVYADSRPSR